MATQTIVTDEDKEDFDRPWEDSLILAFRDIQWKLSIESKLKLADVSKISAKELAPPPIFKLDGKAETTSADVLTLHNSKFFLIEFKSTRLQTISDAHKPIWHLFECIDCQEEENWDFLKLSRKAHHFSYSLLEVQIRQHLDADSRFGILKSCVYYDEVLKKQFDLKILKIKRDIKDIKEKIFDFNKRNEAYEAQKLALNLNFEEKTLENTQKEGDKEFPLNKINLNANQFLVDEIPTFEMLQDANYGLEFADMVAYLYLLKEFIGHDTSTPIKCVMATDTGLVYPLLSLNDIVKAHKLLNFATEGYPEIKEKCNKKISELAGFKDKFSLNRVVRTRKIE